MKELILILLAIALFGCGPLMNLESGRTSGSQNQSFQANLEAFYTTKDDSDINGLVPMGEVKYNYGIFSKLDIGVSATIGGNAQFFTKYQFLGDQESKIAMSIGLKIGKQFLKDGDQSISRFYLPLYFSFHPTEQYAFFFNPMFTKQKVSGDDDSDFFGATTGAIYYFNNSEILLGLNYNNIKKNTISNNLYALGLGYKYNF